MTPDAERARARALDQTAQASALRAKIEGLQNKYPVEIVPVETVVQWVPNGRPLPDGWRWADEALSHHSVHARLAVKL